MRGSEGLGQGRVVAGILLSGLASIVLAIDVIIGFPALVSVLRDPTSHAAQDAGMTALFLLIPIALVGIGCLALAYLLWHTRAGAIALGTAVVVVMLIVGNIGGIPLLVPAVGVAIVGSLLTIGTLRRAIVDADRR